MRKKIVAGNWKMNKDFYQTQSLIKDLIKHKMPEGVTVMVSPPLTNLQAACKLVKDSNSNIIIAAQNMYYKGEGAYTGEVSMSMLKSIGVDHVILGHSERRSIFKEPRHLIEDKVAAAVNNEMTAIFCFGESLSSRKIGNEFRVVRNQLKEGVFRLFGSAWDRIILAYEPVWAIGTGETATPDQVQKMHFYIRKQVAKRYSQKIADNVSILYGGSVKPNNAKEIFNQPDVDGGLIGGAALNANDFMAIVNAF